MKSAAFFALGIVAGVAFLLTAPAGLVFALVEIVR